MANKSIRCILLGTILGAAALANAQSAVTSVEANPVPGGIEVMIHGNGLSKPKALTAFGGKSVILEFDAKPLGGGKRFTVNKAGLEFVQYGWYRPSPPKVRVHMKLDAVQPTTLTAISDGWKLSIGATASVPKPKAISTDSQAMRDAEMALSRNAIPQPPRSELQKAIEAPQTQPIVKSAVEAAPKPKTTTTDDAAELEKAIALLEADRAKSTAKPVAPKPEPTTAAPVASAVPTPLANDLEKAIAAANDDQHKGQGKAPIAKTPKLADSFPETVPPLQAAPVVQRSSGAQMVSLDFVNTDVVQILKALALQAGVNIVTAPEVKGSLTVSLTNVTLKEALDLVTTMAGVRYAQVGKTYVVTTSAKFSEAIRQVGGAKADVTSETRVVAIFSGEGSQIKAAVLKSVPLENGNGRFEIVLPSEELTVESKETVQTEPDKAQADPKAGAAQGDQGTVIATKSGNTQAKQKDQYVVLIGPKLRLDEVEKLVKQLDAQISNAMGVDYPASSTIIHEQYVVRGGNASDLLQALGAKAGKLGNVDIVATPKDSTSRQSIVLTGREHEVMGILKTLSDLDSEDAVLTKMLLYDVKYSDPRALREDLIAQVPGLRVIIPPASAGNPKIYKAGQGVKQGTESVQDQQASNAGAAAATGVGGAQEQKVGGDLEKPGKLSQPFTDFESSAVPMKLILRGTEDQITRGMTYLSAVDTAPRQVALELRVVEMSKDDAIKAGIDWNILGGGAVKILRLANSHPDKGSNAIGANFSGSGFSGDVGATLDRTLDSTKIIARPNMLALDGRESELFVGDTVRYIKSIQSTQNGVTVTTDEVKVGVRLNVMPRIGADGNITMDIRPVVSFLKGFTDVPGGGKLPQTSDRVVQSTVNMMSGETIAIGGLIQDQDKKVEGGLPILMDLPILGHLFKHSTNEKTRTEVVIFLTAKSLDGPANSNYQLPLQVLEPSKTKGKGGKGGN